MLKTRPVNRRAVLQGATGAALLGGQALAAKARRPNIVFFLADDLGYADVACYGRPDIRTPNIDAIAAGGVKFTQGYANSAVCTATRAALITGRYQYRLKVGLEEPLGTAAENVGLPPEHPTLPSLLKAAGYGTTLIGKWHLGNLPLFSPLKSGYDHFWGFRAGALDYFSHQGSSHKDDLWDGDTPTHETGYLTDLIGDRSVTAVNGYAKSGQPFFLDVHFNAPHWPWEGPGDEAESKRIAVAPLRHFDGGSQKTYREMIERMDMQIGRVMKALDANGLARDTICIFTSDNGGERFADTWPFTGHKTELLEGGLRVPMVMRWPAKVARGQVSEQTAMSMDWLPTLLAAAGTVPAASHPTDGINLLPVMTGQARPAPRKLYWRFKANAQRAMRDGDWKVLKILGATFLFNVVDDPLERANLKDRRRDVYDRLIAQWNAWNATMLPELKETFTEAISGDQLADHIGAQPASLEPDLDPAWPEAKVPAPGPGARPPA